MAMGHLKESELPKEVDDWVDLLNRLVEDVAEWAKATGWKPRLTSMDADERGGLRYEVPVLELDRGETEVALVPVAREVPGAEGLVDLYLMPDFDSVASLYREDGQWVFHHAFRPDPIAPRSMIETERLPLDETSLDRVLNDIDAHAQAL